MTIREWNKELGRNCGNCSHGIECGDKRKVCCTHPSVAVKGQNEMNWYRRTKGGCAFHSAK